MTGIIAFAEALNVFTRVEDDSRVRDFRQILAEPLEMLEVILADIRTGLHLDTQLSTSFPERSESRNAVSSSHPSKFAISPVSAAKYFDRFPILS